MNVLDYIAPAYREEPGAMAFGAVLAKFLPWAPSDFGSGYAWETSIPPQDAWLDEAHALAAHLRSFEDAYHAGYAFVSSLRR